MFLPIMLQNKPFWGLPIFYYSSADRGQGNLSQTGVSNNTGIRDPMSDLKQSNKLGPNYIENNNKNNGGRNKHYKDPGEIWCNDLFLFSSLLCLSPVYHLNMVIFNITHSMPTILCNICISLSFIHLMCILSYMLKCKKKSSFSILNDIQTFYNRCKDMTWKTINIQYIIKLIITIIIYGLAIWALKSCFISILSIGPSNKLIYFWLSLSMSSLIRYLMLNSISVFYKNKRNFSLFSSRMRTLKLRRFFFLFFIIASS